MKRLLILLVTTFVVVLGGSGCGIMTSQQCIDGVTFLKSTGMVWGEQSIQQIIGPDGLPVPCKGPVSRPPSSSHSDFAKDTS